MADLARRGFSGQYPGEVPAGANEVAGFGRVNLTESLFGGAPEQPLFSDEPDLAVETGEIRTFVVQAADPGQPLKATLVWTDAPGLPNLGTLQNRLYLRVRDQTGAIVEGDVTPFPAVANNAQQVVIPAPTAGPYEIQVYGVAVTVQAPGRDEWAESTAGFCPGCLEGGGRCPGAYRALTGIERRRLDGSRGQGKRA